MSNRLRPIQGLADKLVGFLLAAGFAAAFCGCSVRHAAVRYAGDMVSSGMPAYLEEEDVQTARETMLSGIKFTEALYRNDPSDKQLARLLAQGYCGYAFLFLEDADAARASVFYRKGADFSAKSLRQLRLLDDRAQLKLGAIPGRAAPLAFWNAFCRAGYLQLNLNNPDAIADLPKIEALADEVIKLSPSYYYNGAYAIKGALYAARPRMLGGDPEKAKSYFDQAVSGGGAEFGMNKFMYAKTYAVQTQDRQLFESLLGQTANLADKLPEQRLANKIAAEKAKRLLEKADELF